MKRRDFIRSSALSGGTLAFAPPAGDTASPNTSSLIEPVTPGPSTKSGLPNLEPARWIWYPSGRCLPNTFVLFRREIRLESKPIRAEGWIAAESRYRLDVNGRRIQWGPAPSDPRFAEADPLDLTGAFGAGLNVIGVTVLYYGHGDGTWPFGKPGFLFRLEIEQEDGRVIRIVSDPTWKAHLARAWRPGQYKRWYLRALQEEFDARLYPHGWTTVVFPMDEKQWLDSMVLNGSPNKPALATDYSDCVNDMMGSPDEAELRPRSVPMLKESHVPVVRLAESFWIDWRRSPQEYFECRPPDSFTMEAGPSAFETSPGHWEIALSGRRGAALTFALEEQVVGWPRFTIDAPGGTTVELLVHEAHAPGGPPLLNTHFDSWTRFICRPGANHFECFDFESLRWLQLHISGAEGRVRVSEVGVRRRVFPWPNKPEIRLSDRSLQRLMDASVNTLNNCAQDTLVDGMARERQQYSGDCGHQLHAIYFAFGETRQPARYLDTFSQGQILDGYFLDSWPGYDRLARLIERQFGVTGWGPILDHGIGFNFDCWHHYLYTGDLEACRKPYMRLIRFARYLEGLRGKDGLLPVENIGVPSVWIDHVAYERQRHKQCAFNLYAAAMFEHALAPLCRAFGDRKQETGACELGRGLLAATIDRFWSPERELFVNNLPWLEEEARVRLCDRSLATAILFDQFPGKHAGTALRALAECPPEMGFSYPANAGWRLWALAKGGRADVILRDLRERWATMDSVKLNNTLQEDWQAKPDSGQQWSHCPVAPLYIVYMGLAGIRPLEPGFSRVEIRPQPDDLSRLELVARTVRGPLVFHSLGGRGARELSLELPDGCAGELVLPDRETVDLKPIARRDGAGLRRYVLPSGGITVLKLKHM